MTEQEKVDFMERACRSDKSMLACMFIEFRPKTISHALCGSPEYSRYIPDELRNLARQIEADAAKGE